MSDIEKTTQAGYIAIIGRPNAGKSTLLNAFLGLKVSITSAKPQTTQQQILAIKSTPETQFVFIDTPGMHVNAKFQNRLMNKAANAILKDVDVVLWVVDATHTTEADEEMAQKLAHLDSPVVVALNKEDRISQLTLLNLTEELGKMLPNAQFVPCSAVTHRNLDCLLEVIEKHLPMQAFIYADDLVTDRSEKFYAAEIIREKLMRHTGSELPYCSIVEIDLYQIKKKVIHIYATIWVEKESHKPIIIGKNGDRLKTISTAARLDLEKFWGKKVFLKVWVKLKKVGFMPTVN
jgi:GTP-binding protein Era